MNGRVLPFDDSAHVNAQALLPWFINGTLEGEERASVERHLAQCARCQREGEALRELQAAYVGSEMAPDAARSLRKLRRQIDDSRPAWRIGRRALRRWWRNPRWARWAVAAQAAVIVVLAVLLLSDAGPPALYRTLGAAVPEDGHGSLVIVFSPQTSEAELRRIMRTVDARVVNGPTETNGYVLELPPGRQAAALKVLRSESAVQLVEPLDTGRLR